MNKKGSLNISSENIFPIIKKWLYSEHDIFLRELVSNSCDAITKLKALASLNEAALTEEELKVVVKFDKENSLLIVEDNGIGMTYDEVDKYINEIAFSGAESFVEKFKDSSNDEQIIGHFGLGFYSAFMVSKKVTIDTLSYKEGFSPVLWSSEGDASYEMSEGTRTTRGTTITLYLSEDGEEFKNEYKIKNVLNKYCSFMPHPIYFESLGEVIDAQDDAEDEGEIKPINTVRPLYTKNPSEITDEEYMDFYRTTFADFKEPLFHIHLNMEYPFNLKGILYFPKIQEDVESLEGRVKLYNSQVFVADNIKEVIPEYLLLLKGVIDCPDLPLNVSRSFLQNDGFVRKISDYISKKVSDKLTGLFKTERENYNTYWKDMNIFVKYGCLKDEKFYEKIKTALIFENTDGSFVSLDEMCPKDKETTVYYVTDREKQASYTRLLLDEGKRVIVLDERIDAAFIGLIESKNEKLKLKRVDSSVDSLKEESESAVSEEVIEKMSSAFKAALNIENLKLEISKLKSKSVSSLIVESEESRRLKDMMKMYSMGAGGMDLPSDEVLVLNENNDLVKNIMDDAYEGETKDLVINQLYDLARLGTGTLTAEDMDKFIARSNEILYKAL